MAVLQDLDTNRAAGLPVSSSQEKGRCSSNAKRCVEIVLNWWLFKHVYYQNEMVQACTLEIVKQEDSTAWVKLELQPDALEPFHGRGYMKLKLSTYLENSVLDLIISRWHLSCNYKTIALFNDDFDVLYKDILKLTDPPTQLRVSEPLYIPLVPHLQATVPTSKRPVASLHQLQPETQTTILNLTKSEVSYLIGHDGSRIEQIRKDSGATIKIIPIPVKYARNEIVRRTRIPQDIHITGDEYARAVARASIDAHLKIHRLCPSERL